MTQLRFEFKGAAVEHYEVVISRHEKKRVSARCTCSAARDGLQCKHRIGVLLGIGSGILGERKKDLATVASWVRESDFKKTLLDLDSNNGQRGARKPKHNLFKKWFTRAEHN
ncbi:MAG: SWIM zinc finger family protein [Mariniblastus sp.]|nr:SWIM zinc finger family protein [Mariniblastus sp.]